MLLQTWRALNPLDRPIHPGLFTSRIDASPQSWSPDEIVGQIDSVRRLSPGSKLLGTPLVPVVYRIDMRDPNSLFVSQAMQSASDRSAAMVASNG